MAVRGSATLAVARLLKTLELDAAGLATAAIARSLAHKLDEAVGSDTATAALAVAGIAKELRATLDAILTAAADDEGLIEGLFAPVGDSPDT